MGEQGEAHRDNVTSSRSWKEQRTEPACIRVGSRTWHVVDKYLLNRPILFFCSRQVTAEVQQWWVNNPWLCTYQSIWLIKCSGSQTPLLSIKWLANPGKGLCIRTFVLFVAWNPNMLILGEIPRDIRNRACISQGPIRRNHARISTVISYKNYELSSKNSKEVPCVSSEARGRGSQQKGSHPDCAGQDTVRIDRGHIK